ncbi:MAG: ABC transporter ATP-binding protein [Candidatus Cloacimonetes bacterium HGW-Cloacimonetes-3]|jgi:phospholipid/cholesterol/gamma-HCH transport system ATP-binding protein|nr:MAG: ABC transporter ATP-binding protein [Candidatus Cloacimonetes bacterium HGW-Cloacimonetes-3]
MIEVKDLCYSFADKQVLKNISFKLENKENLVILGRSGSGKTVLIKTLLGIYTPDLGTVLIDGLDVHHCDAKIQQEIKKRFAMVFQNAALLDSFTVRQNIALPLYERGETDSNVILDKVKACLSLIGLENTINLYPSELSGGMRKRIGIARALVYNPEYIIFDEPVSGLDPITADEILFYISRIIGTAEATLITITHQIESISRVGDQVLFIDNGEVIYSGSVNALFRTDNEFIKRYVAS